MIVRLLLGALCAVLFTTAVEACDAMRPCFANGRLLFGVTSTLSMSSLRHHPKALKRFANRRESEGFGTAHHNTARVRWASPGLARVMAEGAGRAVNWHRPRAWCGWWMRRHLGVANPAGNLARWWAGFGRPAHGPAVGAIVVWRHHVGIITARAERGWVVKSGNDGHRVRERPRSVAGAIAFRWPA